MSSVCLAIIMNIKNTNNIMQKKSKSKYQGTYTDELLVKFRFSNLNIKYRVKLVINSKLVSSSIFYKKKQFNFLENLI